MKSQMNSDPSTPSVSTLNSKFVRGTCRYCGCSGNQCPVPEGQHGFRACFWLDENQTVCAAIPCMIRWQHDQKRSSLPTRDGQLSPLFVYRGVQSRVANRLGVSKGVVSGVVCGRKKSARITAALAEEIAAIEKQLQLSAKGSRAIHVHTQSLDRSYICSPSPKPRVRLHAGGEEVTGEVWASARPYSNSVLIGRRSQEAAG
jgi:hypothetical protein